MNIKIGVGYRPGHGAAVRAGAHADAIPDAIPAAVPASAVASSARPAGAANLTRGERDAGDPAAGGPAPDSSPDRVGLLSPATGPGGVFGAAPFGPGNSARNGLPDLRSPLARAFDGALLAVGARADVGERVAAFVDLVRRYQEPGRHYHTLRHIAEMTAAFRLLTATDRTEAQHVRMPVCLLAIHFHDAVYDPRSADNEVRSAELAATVLAGLGCPDEVIDEVRRLVLATATHVSSATDEAFVNDADLRVLARPAPSYDRYVRRVRLEYAWVGEQAWAQGRAGVLRRLLDGPIYATAWAGLHWEPLARANLSRELAALSSA